MFSQPCSVPPVFRLMLGVVQDQYRAPQEELMISLRDDQYQPVGVQFAKVDGIPVWASTDEAVATVQNVAVNGMSAEVWSVADGVGVTEITCTADADLGAGTVPVVLTLNVEVVEPTAVGGTITPSGAPLDKP